MATIATNWMSDAESEWSVVSGSCSTTSASQKADMGWRREFWFRRGATAEFSLTSFKAGIREKGQVTSRQRRLSGCLSRR
jgi:hypothetical protein